MVGVLFDVTNELNDYRHHHHGDFFMVVFHTVAYPSSKN